jgi:hypothetical protein
MVLTGAYAYIQWAQETTFNTDAMACAAAGDKNSFGFEQKVSSLQFTNNKIPLSQLGDVQVKTFAYGQTQGSFSVEFVLGNPWFFNLLGFSTVCTAGCAAPYTHSWAVDGTTATLDPHSFSMEVGVENGSSDINRTLTGALISSASFSTSVGETVKVSLDAAFANEGVTVGACVLDACNVTECVANHIPYTFAHGGLYWCIAACDAAIAEVQDVSFAIGHNTEHLWGIGNSVAVDKYRRLFELTGNFKLTFENTTELEKVFAQQNDTLCNVACAPALAVSQPTLRLIFWNGVGTDTGGGNITAAAGTRIIRIDLTGIAIDSHSINIEPNEPIFEDIPFQGAGISVTAINAVATAPAAT